MATTASDPTSIRKAQIIAHATVALDGQENAMEWLQRPHPKLNNKRPIDLLFQGNADEWQEVDELLFALEYGIFT